MTRAESQELRKKNNCATCARRGNYPTGCQAFKEEPERCWAHTTDKDWLRKVEKAVRIYSMTHV
jgi:hypothetical protein